MISTASATRMWGIIHEGRILGVYETRTAARLNRTFGVVKPLLVSLA